jgi:hypothetical protein
MEKNISLDGEAATLTSANFLGEASGWFYFTTNFGNLRAKDNVVEKFRPPLPKGTIASLDITIKDGQLFAKAVSETGPGSAIYRFRNEMFEVVHDGEFLDMLPLRSLDLMIRAVRGNEILFSATTAFQAPPFLFINAGAGPLVETAEPFVFGPAGVTITIPEGQFLYRSSDLKRWAKVEVSGTYFVTYNGTEFFQFRSE